MNISKEEIKKEKEKDNGCITTKIAVETFVFVQAIKMKY